MQKVDQTATAAQISTNNNQYVGCDIVYKYPSYEWDTSTMRAICMAESHGKQYATGHNTNGTEDYGLLQINSCHSDVIGNQDVYNPDVNINVAYKIWRGSGYGAWSTYNNGEYIRYL